MDRMDALPILERVIRHWGKRLSNSEHDHWMELLTTLDAGTAGTTYVRLQQKSERCPSPAEFMAEYRTIHPYDGAHRPEQCEHCQDTGWVTCTDHPNHRGHWHGIEDRRPVSIINGKPEPDDCICNIVRPCRCRLGERTAASRYGKQGAAR